MVTTRLNRSAELSRPLRSLAWRFFPPLSPSPQRTFSPLSELVYIYYTINSLTTFGNVFGVSVQVGKFEHLQGGGLCSRMDGWKEGEREEIVVDDISVSNPD